MTTDLPLQILLSDQLEPRRPKIWSALQRLGASEIRSVSDADTAIAWLDRITFDLVLMDLHSPNLNALQVLRHMRRHTLSRHSPFLLCVNAATAREHACAWNAGVTDLVIEPFESETLLRAIWRVPALSQRLADRTDRRLRSGARWDITRLRSADVGTPEAEAILGRETAAGTDRRSCSDEPLHRGIQK